MIHKLLGRVAQNTLENYNKCVLFSKIFTLLQKAITTLLHADVLNPKLRFQLSRSSRIYLNKHICLIPAVGIHNRTVH